MIGVGVITHGGLAAGFENAVKMIMGATENFDIASLEEGADLEQFQTTTVELVKSLNKGAGVLLFVDMFGATPFNTIAQVRAQFAEKNIAVHMITGVNLPMLMEALAMRQGMPLEDLALTIVNSGQEAIQGMEISATE